MPIRTTYPPIRNPSRYGCMATFGCNAVGNIVSNTAAMMKGTTMTAILLFKNDVIPREYHMGNVNQNKIQQRIVQKKIFLKRHNSLYEFY